MNSTIYLLIKVFEKEEYADSFLKDGEMYCMTLGDFKRIEGDAARGDAYEGTGHGINPIKFLHLSLLIETKMETKNNSI